MGKEKTSKRRELGASAEEKEKSFGQGRKEKRTKTGDREKVGEEKGDLNQKGKLRQENQKKEKRKEFLCETRNKADLSACLRKDFLPRPSFIREAINFCSIYKVMGAISVQTSGGKHH